MSGDGLSWQDCAAAGMSASEAARAKGATLSAASHAARRLGLTFRDARRDQANAERMRRRNADPKFRATLRNLHADPEIKAARAERIRRLHANPAFNPLVRLTEAERADYDRCKRAGMTRDEALRAIRRTDLIETRPAEDPA